MRHYVSIEHVSEETLSFLGYILFSEDEHTKVYYHLGEEIIVDKADPFIYVDDANDVPLFRGDVMAIPNREDD